MKNGFSLWLPVRLDYKGRLKIPVEILKAMPEQKQWALSLVDNGKEFVMTACSKGECSSPDGDGRVLTPLELRPVLAGRQMLVQGRKDHLSVIDEDVLMRTL
jgi:hypothetical protein